MEKKNIKPARVDAKAPKALEISIKTVKNKSTGPFQLFNETASLKVFSTGSTGYYCNGKFINQKSGERYQVSCSIILIGSKPEKKKGKK